MQTIMIVFGGLEAALLVLCGIWAIFFAEEIEILMPIAYAFFGSIILFICWLVTIVIHDHIHLGIS